MPKRMTTGSLLVSIFVTAFPLLGVGARNDTGYEASLAQIPARCQDRACYCPALAPRIRAALADELRDIQTDLQRVRRENRASEDVETARFSKACDTSAIIFRPSTEGNFEALRFSSAYVRGNILGRFFTRISLAKEIRSLPRQPFKLVPLTGRISIPAKYMPKKYRDPRDIDDPQGLLYAEMRREFTNNHLTSQTRRDGDQIEISLLLEGQPGRLARSLDQFHPAVDHGLVGQLIESLNTKPWASMTISEQKERLVAILNECEIQETARALRSAKRNTEEITLTHYLVKDGRIGFCADYYLSARDQGKGGKAFSLDNLETILTYGRPLRMDEANRYFSMEMADNFGKFFGSIAKGLSAENDPGH